MRTGFFLTLDGTDGSGKTTQTELLVARLKKDGCRVETISFPRYGEKSAAMIEEYLNGAFGTADEVGPYRAAIFFALDRYAASPIIKTWLAEGALVIANRYVGSNMAYQGGKIGDATKRDEFFAWLYDLEYNIFGIPKSDLNLLLHAPAAEGQKLVDKKGAREYLRGKRRDILEDDLKHLIEAETAYLEIATRLAKWQVIECAADGQMLPAGQVHELIYQAVAAHLRAT